MRLRVEKHLGSGAVILATLFFAGCGSSNGYPETSIRSPLGREGVCFACQKKLPSVTEAHLVTVTGIQLTVCDGICGAKAEAALLQEE